MTIFIGIALIVFTGVIVWLAIYQESEITALKDRIKRLDTGISNLQVDYSSLADRTSTIIRSLAEILNKMEDREKKVEETFQVVKKELDIMIVRQRTLEKKIIISSGERTVNLVFRGNVPVENVPHIINKEKKSRGRGKSALIPTDMEKLK